MGGTVHPGVQAVADDQDAFVAPAVRAAQRVLEVGCGRGLLAARLAAAGHHVVAIDPHLPPATERPIGARLTFVEADLLDFEAPPFDALVLASSLHHIAPLGAALARAYELLAPGGLLVVDDFDLEAPDLATLRWYYDTQEVLAAAGAYDADRIDGVAEQEPHDRWRVGHEPRGHGASLHAGDSMLAGISSRFANVRDARGPYLWRYIARGITGRNVAAIAAAVHTAEERGVVAGTLTAAGLRITARRPA